MNPTDLLRALHAAAERPDDDRDAVQFASDFTHLPAANLATSLLAGAAAPSPSHAFAAAYALAVREQFGLGSGALGALLYAERGASSPRTLHTTLQRVDDEHFVLDGHKSFVTFGDRADLWWVIAREPHDDPAHPARLRAVRVLPQQAQVGFEPMEARGALLDLPRGHARFERLRVPSDAVLPGDAYALHVRPFRLEENRRVLSALLGQVLRLSLGRPSPALLADVTLAWSALSLHEHAPHTELSQLAHAALADELPRLLTRHQRELSEAGAAQFEALRRDLEALGALDHAARQARRERSAAQLCAGGARQ